MRLQPSTIKILQNSSSIHQRNLKGFHTEEQIKKFWRKQNGATGFLNIKEITPEIVAEIRKNIIT